MQDGIQAVVGAFDLLCTTRQEGESESSRRVKTGIPAGMEGVQSSKAQLLVLGATNCPCALDTAVRRRFAKVCWQPACCSDVLSTA